MLTMRSLPVLAALALLAALGLWLVLRPEAGRDPVTPAVASAPEATPAAPVDLIAPAEPVPEPSEPAPRRPAEVEPGAAERQPAPVDVRADPAGQISVVLELLLPDREKPEVDGARVTLAPEEGAPLVLVTSDNTVGAAVPVGRYELSLEAVGHRHVPETLDLSQPDQLELTGRSFGQSYHHRVYLWPEDVLPVIVRTRDGRPFHAITEDLGLEPRRFFVHAFSIAAAPEPFPAEGPFPSDPGPVTFASPEGYQNTLMGDSIAGALELHEPRPFWVGLWLHGIHYENRFLRAGDTELVFEIDLAALDSRFARVVARVVDRHTGVPVLGALGTLKADTSAHRRHDLQEVASDEDGLIVFERVIPGQHELTVTRGANLFQRRLQIGARYVVNLDVSLGSGEGVPLRVVDAEGKGLDSVIEIAPYRVGAATDDLYHPNLHRRTDSDGNYTLPVPDQTSIVRARPYFYGSSSYPSSIGTHNVLFDPDALPAELVIVAQKPTDVRFEVTTPWKEGQRLTIMDELDLVVMTVTRIEKEIELVPGSYAVRRWDGDEELCVFVAVIGEEPGVLQVP
jgi:hypothetical protein